MHISILQPFWNEMYDADHWSRIGTCVVSPPRVSLGQSQLQMIGLTLQNHCISQGSNIFSILYPLVDMLLLLKVGMASIIIELP